MLKVDMRKVSEELATPSLISRWARQGP